MPPRRRLSPLHRGLSALLVLAYVAVALGATRHAGDHDESGLEWLPRQFHHHHYDLTAEGSDAGSVPLGICAACHWSRLGQRPVAEGPVAPEAGPVLRTAAVPDPTHAVDRASLLPDSRGPPSA